jgi:predicted enzyme related to lactoylglutathione lyase
MHREPSRQAIRHDEVQPMLKKVAFTMYPVRDVARARQFYEEALGLKVGLKGNQGDKWWVEYDLPGGGCLALTNFTGEPSAGAGGTIAFEVEDLDALIADLKSKSVTFLGEVVHGPRCRMITCLDSEGNAIVLHQLNAKT